jgi:hypothetical protein
MPSASGLSRDQRIRCRDRVVQAARLTLANKEHTHYTEGPLRWDGIKNRKDAEIGQFPEYSDCSSFATWCLWNGIYGSGPPGVHCAVIVDMVNGTPMVISHGSEPGPFDLAYNYRSDVLQIRRYI